MTRDSAALSSATGSFVASAPNATGSPDLAPGSESPRTPWWLWPHLLSLDAPLVALCWQRWWAYWAGVRLGWREGAILSIGVWMIYLSDRLADTSPALNDHCDTARHRFHRQRRWLMTTAAATTFVALAFFTPWVLPLPQFVAGLGLLALAASYFWVIHRRRHMGWSRIFPKEASVGAMFAAGTSFFIFWHGTANPQPWLLALPLFGTLCFCNCAMITRWERSPTDTRETFSLLNAFPGVTAHLREVCLGLAVVAGVGAAVFGRGGVFLPIALSGLLLAALDRHRATMSLDGLRVLADVVLLTPLLGLVLLSHRL